MLCGYAVPLRETYISLMAAWDAVKEAKHPRIHVFLATSDIHEELAMAIRTRADFYDAETGINTRQIYRSSKLLSNITGVFVRFKDLADKKISPAATLRPWSSTVVACLRGTAVW